MGIETQKVEMDVDTARFPEVLGEGVELVRYEMDGRELVAAVEADNGGTRSRDVSLEEGGKEGVLSCVRGFGGFED